MIARRKAFTMRASSIGDALMAKYFLENVKLDNPSTECYLVVAGMGNMLRDLLSAYPWIKVIEANRRSLISVVAAFKTLFSSDIALTQYSSRGRFSSLSKIFARMVTKFGGLAGFEDGWFFNRIFFDKLLPFDSKKALILHEQEALGSLQIPVKVESLRLDFVADDTFFKRLELIKDKYIVVHFFAGTSGRGLKTEKASEMLERICSIIPESTEILISGGVKDIPYAEKIKGKLRGKIIAGKTTLNEMVNIINESIAVISVDTGIAHIAAHLGKPLIVLRSCVSYNWWAREQYGREIRVISADSVCAGGHIAKDFPDCLNAINIDEVFLAVKDFNKKSKIF